LGAQVRAAGPFEEGGRLQGDELVARRIRFVSLRLFP
jgi:hypothetical protein